MKAQQPLVDSIMYVQIIYHQLALFLSNVSN